MRARLLVDHYNRSCISVGPRWIDSDTEALLRLLP